MPLTVRPIPTLDERINDIRMRTAEIVNDDILPNERALWRSARGGSVESEPAVVEAKELREQIKQKVRKAGLWAPHLPPEAGGSSGSFLVYALMVTLLFFRPLGLFGKR